MKEALYRKIAALPEQIQEIFLLMPVELLVLLLKDPEPDERDAQQIGEMGMDLSDRPPGQERRFGALKGKIVMADDFGDPIPGFEDDYPDDSQMSNLQKSAIAW
jgi:hypothetical protein